MALLRINNGEPVPVATIATSIEEVEGMVSYLLKPRYMIVTTYADKGHEERYFAILRAVV